MVATNPTADAADAAAADKPLTVAEAAAELGVGRAVVYAGIEAGVIPRLPLPGRRILIPRRAFDQYKRGELDEHGQERRRPTARQADLLKGVKPILRRR